MANLFLIKLIVSVVFILILSYLAEKISPKFAGIISGVPTGTAIIIFFYGLEQGTDFASKSSVFNLAGMLSMQVFLLLYLKFQFKDKKLDILLTSLIAILGYFITILILRQFHFTIFTALIIPIIFIPLFTFLFKKIENVKIQNKVKLSKSILLVRIIIAISIILLVTGIAKIVGPEWAGLFSSFPTTLFPLMLIIHLTYEKRHVNTIIKNVPKGQWAMVIYVLAVFFLYPLFGIYLGTLISYSLVIIYLFLLFYIERRSQ
ncbi:MAG TPA: hypothetical protein VJH92_05995 [Candidatus Nanoarchaeia archaeon]|nr:hypothetical protein [Candidatus Nanoarchaeia archaeon]